MLYGQKCLKLDDNIKRKMTLVKIYCVDLLPFFFCTRLFLLFYLAYLLLTYFLWQLGYTYLMGVPVYSWIVKVSFSCQMITALWRLFIVVYIYYLKLAIQNVNHLFVVLGLNGWIGKLMFSRGRKRHVWSHTVHLAVLLKLTTFLEIVPTYIKDCGFCCFQITFTF